MLTVKPATRALGPTVTRQEPVPALFGGGGVGFPPRRAIFFKKKRERGGILHVKTPQDERLGECCSWTGGHDCVCVRAAVCVCVCARAHTHTNTHSVSLYLSLSLFLILCVRAGVSDLFFLCLYV